MTSSMVVRYRGALYYWRHLSMSRACTRHYPLESCSCIEPSIEASSKSGRVRHRNFESQLCPATVFTTTSIQCSADTKRPNSACLRFQTPTMLHSPFMGDDWRCCRTVCVEHLNPSLRAYPSLQPSPHYI